MGAFESDSRILFSQNSMFPPGTMVQYVRPSGEEGEYSGWIVSI